MGLAPDLVANIAFPIAFALGLLTLAAHLSRAPRFLVRVPLALITMGMSAYAVSEVLPTYRDSIAILAAMVGIGMFALAAITAILASMETPRKNAG